MEGSSFDRITRRLAVTTSRRRGLAALVAGALGIAGISAAEAVVPIPPDCRATGMECVEGIPCCSGRCILKFDGTSRCARKTSNRKPKEKESETCLSRGEQCERNQDCCKDLVCGVRPSSTSVDGQAIATCNSANPPA